MPAFQPGKGEHLRELIFEGNWPSAVTFTNDTNTVVAGNRDGEIFLWDLTKDPKEKNVAPVRKLEGHTNGITHLICVNEGRTLISSSLDHTVRYWDLTAKPTGKAEVITNVHALEEAARRKKEVPAEKISVDVQQAEQIIDVHSEWVSTMNISRDEKRLITGDDKGLVVVWDVASRKEISRWQGYPGNWIVSAALSPNGEQAFCAEYCSSHGSFDRPPAQAKFWNVADGKELIDLLAVQFPKVKERDSSYGYSRTWSKLVGRGFVTSEISPDGKLLAVGMGGETSTAKVHLFDTQTGKLVRTISGHQSGVTDLKFSDDGQYVLTTGRDTIIRICKTNDGKEVATIGKARGGQFKDWLYTIALSPDQKQIVGADISGRVQIWKLA